MTLFNNKNGTLVEKLELLLLRFESPEILEQFNKVKSLWDKLVGESIPCRGRFRKLKVEHESLLSGVWEAGAASTSAAPAVPPRIRKEYDFLKPSMIHSDCTKRNS